MPEPTMTHEPHCNDRCIHYLAGESVSGVAPDVPHREPVGRNSPSQGGVTDSPAPEPGADAALCPAGCGCRLWTEDADSGECGCDGPCCFPSWDDYVWHVLAYPADERETFVASRDMTQHRPFPPLARPTPALDEAWAETRAALSGHQRLIMFSNQSGVSYVQVLDVDPDSEDGNDLRPVVTRMAYPEKPELHDSSWADALRLVREALAARAAEGGTDR